jgi:L-proline amide hydrolase
MLGSSHAASRPKGLRRLVLANSPASVELWMQSIQKLRAELPKDVQEVIDEAERSGKTESPEYQEAVGLFYKKHLCRAEPWPAPEVQAALRWLTKDTTVYGTI